MQVHDIYYIIINTHTHDIDSEYDMRDIWRFPEIGLPPNHPLELDVP